MSQQKVWFITGSSRGFGRVWAEAVLKRGDKVAASARNPKALKAFVEAYGDGVLPLKLDVTDRDAVFQAVRKAHQHFGRLDVILSNAGYGVLGAIEEFRSRTFGRTSRPMCSETLSVIQAALRCCARRATAISCPCPASARSGTTQPEAFTKARNARWKPWRRRLRQKWRASGSRLRSLSLARSTRSFSPRSKFPDHRGIRCRAGEASGRCSRPTCSVIRRQPQRPSSRWWTRTSRRFASSSAQARCRSSANLCEPP